MAPRATYWQNKRLLREYEKLTFALVWAVILVRISNYLGLLKEAYNPIVFSCIIGSYFAFLFRLNLLAKENPPDKQGEKTNLKDG